MCLLLFLLQIKSGDCIIRVCDCVLSILKFTMC